MKTEEFEEEKEKKKIKSKRIKTVKNVEKLIHSKEKEKQAYCS